MNNYSLFKKISKYFLVLTALVPLVVTRFSIYPFVFGKSILYTGLVELSLISIALYFLFEAHRHNVTTSRVSAIQWGILAFLCVSLLLSTIFSSSPYISFWGTTEKGDGFFYYIHFFLFVILSSMLFEKIDWQRLTKGFMGTAVIISLLAWGERFSFSGIDFQPVSSLGNPAYLAAYLLLALALVAITTPKVESEKYKESYIALYVFVGMTLIMLQVRGAILGLGVGIFGYALYTAVYSHKITARKFAAIFCVSVVVLASIFITTRKNSFWQHIPVVKKFAAISTESGSVAERFSAWNAGVKGFKARPLAGWGNEQFDAVYNEYGVTNIEKYKESWFTGAHNKIIDVLVTGGVVGLLAYALLIGSILVGLRTKPLALALFVAYLIQNMFIFDTISSSMVLFSIVGYLFFERKNEVLQNPKHCGAFVCRLLSVVVIVAALVSLTYTVVIPFVQQRAFSNFLRVSSGEKLESLFDSATTPFNAHQQPTRIAIVNLLRDYDAVKDVQGRQFFARAVVALEEVHRKDPRDMQTVVALLESYIDLGEFESAYYAKADELAKEALTYAPQTFKIMHLRSVALVGQKKYVEARELLASALSKFPNSVRTKIYIAFEKNQTAPAESRAGSAQILDSVDAQYLTLEKRDFSTSLLLFAQQKNTAGVAKIAALALSRYSQDKHFYQFALTSCIVEKNAEAFLKVLDKMALAPYAASLPLSQWKDTAAQNNWDALAHDDFFADTFGKLTAL